MASRWTKSSIRAASIIARAGSQLHGATVARLQTLTPGYQKEAGVLGKVEQREDGVEGIFSLRPAKFPPSHLSLPLQASLPPARPLHRLSLSLSLSDPSLPFFIPVSLPSTTDQSLAHVFGLRYHVSYRSIVDSSQFSRYIMEPLLSLWINPRPRDH